MATQIQADLVPKEQILEKVMNLFWVRGAETASYNDIVVATGLSRKSLYAHWPDKDALIKDTLNKYYTQMLDFIKQQMSAGGRKGLEFFWDDFENAAKKSTWAGCYLHRTASGPLRSAPYITHLYRSYMEDFVVLLGGHIVKGQKEGEIDKTIDAKAAGLICFSLVGTMSTIGAQTGYDERVAEMFQLVRKTSGVSVAL